ncbi:MAG: UDP-N-acetylmuramate--L-alanine ligase [Planctomycetota bacterium]
MPSLVEGPAVSELFHPRLFQGLRIHMIGIGGCGMSGAAHLLLGLGATVSGSDLMPFDGMAALVQCGARVSVGHREGCVSPETDLVVTSAAIPPTNPEFVAAVRFGKPIIKYAQLLGELMKVRRGIAIAGTHGKSTTTAWSAHIFREAGLDPSYVFGAHCEQLGGHSSLGKGPHFIVESCEFDRSFLYLEPESAAILNVEADHLDCYRDLDEIVDAFGEYAAQVRPGGLLVINGQDDRARLAASRCRAEVQTFGFDPGVDWRAFNLRSDRGRFAFDLSFQGTEVLSTSLSLPGRHNVANALAAIALARHAGADFDSIGKAVTTFLGVKRRLTWRGEGHGVIIIDDYAHHPTEVRVSIEAARYRYSPKRTWVVFQPHQYSRTRYFMDDFAESFDQADEVVVPDVYGAREKCDSTSQHASEELVSRIVRHGGRAHYAPSLEAATDHVCQNVTEGDMVLTMGAGDVWKVADELVERVCRRDATRRPTWTPDLVPSGGACSVSVSAA